MFEGGQRRRQRRGSPSVSGRGTMTGRGSPSVSGRRTMTGMKSVTVKKSVMESVK